MKTLEFFDRNGKTIVRVKKTVNFEIQFQNDSVSPEFKEVLDDACHNGIQLTSDGQGKSMLDENPITIDEDDPLFFRAFAANVVSHKMLGERVIWSIKETLSE